jgi:predicted PurR-regulated permease PerM
VREAGASLAPSGESLTRAGNALAGGIGGVGVAFVVTIYLLLDGRRTYAWLVAFVPAPARPRMHETGECARTVVAAYVRGNVITSVLATVATWIALAIMQVPAAFVLAVFAGLMNFVPVVGMLISAAPAILLGLAKSPAVALGVAAFFALYNLVENYYIQPAVYGRELRLSALAVIVAFLVGAQLGGVLGALISLPMAAMYPCIERIWFSRSAQAETADEHRRIEAQPEH